MKFSVLLLFQTVVSGSEEPDTIELRRVDEERLIIKNKIIGSKNRRIVVKGWFVLQFD